MKKTICIIAISALAGACTGAAMEDEGVTAQQQALAEDTTEAVQLVGSLAWELSQTTEAPAERGRDLEPTADGAPPPEVSELDAERCTTVQWDAEQPLAIGLTFADCPLEGGATLNGAVRVYLDHDGVRGAVGVEMMALSVGAQSLDGFMTLSSDGDDLQIDCDVRYVDADTDVQLVLTAVRLTREPDGFHLNGAGEITDAGDTSTATFNDVVWATQADCHPTAGSIDLTLPGSPPMTVLFSAEGVTLQVGALPPFPIAAPSC